MSQKKTIKRVTEETIVAPRESDLAKILTEDRRLSEDRPRLQLFLTLANYFDDDLEKNIFLNAFELDRKYTTYNPNAWTEFKQYSPVTNYINKFIQEINYTEAARTISSTGIHKAKDAIDVQDIIDGKRELDKNTNVIVFLIPQRKYHMYEKDD